MHDGEEEPCSYLLTLVSQRFPRLSSVCPALDDSAATTHRKSSFPVVRRTEYRHNNKLCVHVVNCVDTDDDDDDDDRRLQLKLFAARHQNAFRDMYGVVYQNHSELLVRLLH
ncbi:uncharacterized protein BO87DRAFT_141415 [Aspergillus neoniger CBS 115656]|uniref:Uncharacterized protein n=1 Tax=Aspergillus neoniger (strain CBS 115656) TaxID=1448310 RepID=A0A318YA30_ASPNB|nr:hypothetical protein BO87DRAFT_141415 [Aspergillus neoniger CBS 115656]PYH31176.1 hypothetical protein BO87DRAFT_141415 [Aspergillus neoniger CBS 115656]